MAFSLLLQKIRSALIQGGLAFGSASRKWFYRIWFPSMAIGQGVTIGRHVSIRIVPPGRINLGDRVSLQDFVLLYCDGGHIDIGSDTYVGRYSEIVARQAIHIGRDVLIASGCVIRDADHRSSTDSEPIRRQGHIVKPVIVGDDVWLGSHVVVTAGSAIGAGSVLGANAVVRGSIPPRSIAVGAPARVTRSRDQKDLE